MRETLPNHHRRNPDIRRDDDAQSAEPLGRDADHSEREVVDVHDLSHNLGVRSKPALPDPVAEDGHRMARWVLIFLRQKAAAQERFHAEDREVIPGDQLSHDNLWPTVSCQGHGEVRVRGHSGEDLVTVPQVLVVWKGCRAVEAAPYVRGSNSHESLGLLHGQRAEQERVGKAEDRRVGTNPQSQRGDGDDGEAPILDQRLGSIA